MIKSSPIIGIDKFINVTTYNYCNMANIKEKVVMGKRGPKIEFHDLYHVKLREIVAKCRAKKKKR